MAATMTTEIFWLVSVTVLTPLLIIPYAVVRIRRIGWQVLTNPLPGDDPFEQACVRGAAAGLDLLCIGNNLRYEERAAESAAVVSPARDSGTAFRRRTERTRRPQPQDTGSSSRLRPLRWNGRSRRRFLPGPRPGLLAGSDLHLRWSDVAAPWRREPVR